MLPPIEQISYELGSGGYQSPSAAAARLTSTLSAPGSTTATRLSVSISTARIRSVDSTMPPSTASAPPDRPEPAPRGTTGMPCALAQRMVTCTCSAVSARTTARGVPAVASWVQSKRYFSRASGAVTTTPSGSIPTSSVTTASMPSLSHSPALPASSAEVVVLATTSALEAGAVENSAAGWADPSRLLRMETWTELAAAQAGVLSWRQLRELEVPRGLVRNKVVSGRWARRTEEVFTTTTGPLSPEQRLWLAVLHCGPHAMVG